MAANLNRRNLLASESRVQAPWVKAVIGDYTFGVYSKESAKNLAGFYKGTAFKYPSYVKKLSIVKINGQVNQYTLEMEYPVRPGDDPNYIEKVLSSVSSSRKIIFSYGDSTNPAYVYKDEEAIMTSVTQNFNLEASTITYTIKAVSSAALAASGSFTFVNTGKKKPSEEIRRVFKANSTYGLQDIFTGMSMANFDKLVAGDDKAVELDTKTNISPLDYVSYLVGCMLPASSSTSNLSKEIYILTLHDETVFDKFYSDTASIGGPYFKVTKTSTAIEYADAYEVDVGYNTRTMVLAFSVENNNNFSLLYDYNSDLAPEAYTRRLNDQGQWEDLYAPMYTSGNNQYLTRPEDTVWYTKLTKYPVNATLRVLGLLRPIMLMQYIRLNIIFPGGNKHIASGLYIITKQLDEISDAGYFTTLSITRISD